MTSDSEQMKLNFLMEHSLAVADRLEDIAVRIRQKTWRYGAEYERNKDLPPMMLGVRSLSGEVIHEILWAVANLNLDRLAGDEAELTAMRERQE